MSSHVLAEGCLSPLWLCEGDMQGGSLEGWILQAHLDVGLSL